MFYWLYELQGTTPGIFRLFGSPVFRAMAALATALVTCLVLYPWLIRQLQLKQIGQIIRDDGPESHFAKRGTPTMGGTLLVISVVGACLLWCNLNNPFVWLTLVITVVYAIVGFLDDFLKLHHKNTGGLSERWKILMQVGSVALVMWYFFLYVAPGAGYDTTLNFPFVKPETFQLILPPWAYAIFAGITIFATSTACNLTDGLDGLAIGPTIVSASTFAIICYLTGATLFGFQVADYLLLPRVEGVDELAVFCAAMVGAGIGFLWFNMYPAMVFMGDVGALALGGALGAVAVFSKQELLSVIVHGIFVVEFLSVIIQRYSFRWTGKRVFAMAPIHHHFEKKGWPESRITVRFWIISVMLALLALASIKVR
jgi:phospho-N-acetylmuramoyl-pentapeptide-transferase